MGEHGAVSLLPPLLALGLALWIRQVYVSLALGIWLGWTILTGWNPFAGAVASVDALVGVFADRDRTLIILLSAMIGAVITLTQYSGGMSGFIDWIAQRGLVTTKRAAGVLAWTIGFSIFVEANIGVFVAGPVSRPIFDRLRLSREKLAYLLDSTASAKATLIPINSWGAYIMGLLAAEGLSRPLAAMLGAMAFNLYAIFSVLLALVVAWKELDLGPMKEAERRVSIEGKLLRDGAEPLVSADVLMMDGKPGVPQRPVNMFLPVIAIVVTVLVALLVTGQGSLMAGDGATSVFWAVLAGVLTAAVSYRVQGILTLGEITEMFMKGVGGLVPIVILLVFAFVIGDTCRALGTGAYVATAAEAGLPSGVVPAGLFLVSAVTSFSTGTSWGTWAIMIPIGVPMIEPLGLPAGLVIGSVLSGGLFGDHCSPISDSTIISSMAAGTDHIDHVRTQLPYALVAGAATVVLYLILGFSV